MAATQPTFDRRAPAPHAQIPQLLNPYAFCQHADPYCADCAPEGTILHSNHDTESRSWWVGAPISERKTYRAFFLLGAFGIALGVQAKLRENPNHFVTDRPVAASASRD